MYTPEEIKELVKSATHYKLVASSRFWWGSYDMLAEICNGCGPEDSPYGRNILTAFLTRYEVVWAIHDVDYEFHTCSKEEADKRMRNNMIKVWAKDFGFWRWLSFAGIFNRVFVIPVSYAIVSTYGKDAWDNIKGVKHEKSTNCDDVCSSDDGMSSGGKTTGSQR